jgi:ribosomal protein S18 acetylase RimI-like enzyme
MSRAAPADPSAGDPPIVIRPAAQDDLPTCAAIWRESLNDYLGRRNVPEIPDDVSRVIVLYEHLLATDPGRFLVAERAPGEPGAGEVVAFGAAIVREPLWYLSMLFVRPTAQGRGLGRRLTDALLPAPESGLARAVGADSMQPISNALYASLGMVPRMPIWHLVGDPPGSGRFPPLPPGIRAEPFDALAAGPPDGAGHRELVAAVGELDRAIAGFEHPQDLRHVRIEGRTGFLYRDESGAAVGYGYAGRSGRMGPVAVREAELLPAVVGHLVDEVPPAGAHAIWMPGAAGPAFTALLQAGFRLDGFPVLLCWDRPFADFSRYVPISPGLL